MRWGKLAIAAMTLSAAMAVGSCATTPENCRLNYTATGAAVGAVAGAGAGAAIAASSGASGGAIAAATAGGAVVGGLIGAVAGRQQDQACRQMALNRALNQAAAVNESRGYRPRPSSGGSSQSRASAPSGPAPRYQSVEWANEATSNTGKIQPLAPAEGPGDQVCMTYYDQQSTSGATQATTGKACRGSDGQWRPTS